MDRAFALALQEALLLAGYDDAELKYLSDTIATFSLTSHSAVRKLGVELTEQGHARLHEGTADVDAQPLLVDFSTVKELATAIFDRDPGTHTLPDFKHFTGLNDET